MRLRHVEECEEERRQIAARYLAEIQNDKLILPGVQEGATAVWHQFVVRSEQRDELKNIWRKRRSERLFIIRFRPICQRLISIWAIRRAISHHRAVCATGTFLPMYNGMTEEEQSYVIDAINAFKIK